MVGTVAEDVEGCGGGRGMTRGLGVWRLKDVFRFVEESFHRENLLGQKDCTFIHKILTTVAACSMVQPIVRWGFLIRVVLRVIES